MNYKANKKDIKLSEYIKNDSIVKIYKSKGQIKKENFLMGALEYICTHCFIYGVNS
ncbi:hypothetical protein PV797_19690 [Clostridiaceae bacterium M8S5]|nr:hypothetical protein PV797_19690 [Clostridiaceae bacterium M8S5]